MTTAVLLRSGMRRNSHVPFCRAVGGATLSLTLILLSSKNNADRLNDAIEELRAGGGTNRELIDE